MSKQMLELAKGLREAAHYCTELSELEKHCNDIAGKLDSMARQCSAVSETEVSDLRRAVIELRDWKDAVISKCKASDGFDALAWGGDKEGWGFIHHFIGHLETRALHADAMRTEPQAADLEGAVRALFDGGFIDAGTRENSQWAQELERRLKPVREALTSGRCQAESDGGGK